METGKNKGNLRNTRTEEQVKDGRDFYMTKCQVEEAIKTQEKRRNRTEGIDKASYVRLSTLSAVRTNFVVRK